MSKLKAGLVTAIVVASTVVASPSRADTEIATSIAEETVGAEVTAMRSPITRSGVTISPAVVDGRAKRTLAASTPQATSVIAVLDGSEKARGGEIKIEFDLGLPEGTELEAQPDGSVALKPLDNEKIALMRLIDRPWARDAKGKYLNTRYEVSGDTLVQFVDTAGVRFPVVADPRVVDLGLHWTQPVVYLALSRTETVRLRNIYRNDGATEVSTALCAIIPNVYAGIACAGLVASKIQDFKNNLNDAYANGSCVRIRFPYGTVTPFWFSALDFYRKAC